MRIRNSHGSRSRAASASWPWDSGRSRLPRRRRRDSGAPAAWSSPGDDRRPRRRCCWRPLGPATGSAAGAAAVGVDVKVCSRKHDITNNHPAIVSGTLTPSARSTRPFSCRSSPSARAILCRRRSKSPAIMRSSSRRAARLLCDSVLLDKKSHTLNQTFEVYILCILTKRSPLLGNSGRGLSPRWGQRRGAPGRRLPKYRSRRRHLH